METVLGEAKAGGLGSINAEPWFISATSKALACGLFADLVSANADGPCHFALDGPAGTWRGFACPHALAANTACVVLADRWSRPHFVSACFGLWAWSAEVQFAGVSPLGPACWLGEKDKSRSSTSKVVQDVWDFHLET